jgi:catechol 2,3-dioxygenase-like lactoylglutathione lyase family enzyme
MPAKFQITVDCSNPDLLARFWSTALGYELEEPPDGSPTWAEYWRRIGVPDDELDDGYDSIIEPGGRGPRIWFQRRPEPKQGINRLHFDLLVSDGRKAPIEVRMESVDAEVQRLEEAGARVHKRIHSPEVDHYFVAMRDPEGNEFDVS